MGKTAILGFGCAGYHAAKALRACCPDASIDVYTQTVEGPANPMLTTYFASEKIPDGEMFPFGNLEGIAGSLRLNVFAGTTVQKLNAVEREVVLADGTRRRYDDIVVATGADALIPPIPGLPQKGIFAMRTPDDARRLHSALDGSVRSALVIGASMVGIKVVELFLKKGIRTSMADMAPYIFPLSAFEDVAGIIHKRLEERGVRLVFGQPIQSLRETPEGIVSVFGGGTEISSDIVVFCMGTRARLSILDKEEVEIGRAVKVDLGMRTSVPHVYAAGDCCETTNVQSGQSLSVGLWANAVKQGEVAGKNIAGRNVAYQGNLIHNITHFLDMDFISVGDNRIQGERVSFRHPKEGWIFEGVFNGNAIGCVNILDNFRVSGPVKNALLKHLAAPGEKGDVVARLVLRKSGLPERLIERLIHE